MLTDGSAALLASKAAITNSCFPHFVLIVFGLSPTVLTVHLFTSHRYASDAIQNRDTIKTQFNQNEDGDTQSKHDSINIKWSKIADSGFNRKSNHHVSIQRQFTVTADGK